jgi:phenylpropionate dioxygenase-like ring-hydroxylating dioxygenase large terminal subunit
MATRTQEPGTTQTVHRERATRVDVRQLAPATGLREYWYPVIEDRKVGRKPVGLKVCNEQLVFFRGKDKQVKALRNVCPHRGGSLMHGDCHFEGTISCPYHGWTFDGEGNVLAVLPEGPDSQVPGKVVQRSYPTRTLRGMVFVWMGEEEPAPIEEDVPPEFFTDEGQMLYAWEVWPVNWRVAVENAGDAHVPYVHRDAALVLLNPMTMVGNRNPRTNIINGRAATFGSRPVPQPPSENGSNGHAAGAQAFRRPVEYQYDFPALGEKWPKHRRRLVWTWLTRRTGRRRYSKPPMETHEEWAGMLHHLPSMVRLDYHTHLYTRVNIPIDEDNTRQIYWHFTRGSGWFSKLREKVLFHTWHRWAMYSDFSVQDFRAAGPQRYDTPEHLSSTDSHLIIWRRLLLKARGMSPLGADEHQATPAEEFSQSRQADLGLTPEQW